MMNKLQIEQELVRIIQKITGIENKNIRISYQKTGMPSIKVDFDYCFVSLNFFDTEYTQPIETEFNAQEEIESYKGTRGIIANLVLYGTNAFENASKIRVMIKDTSSTKNLRKNGVYLLCNVSEPRRVPISINQQWYDQVYLDLRFYQKIMYNTDRHYIDSAEIKVISDHKEQDINIKQGEN